MADKEAAPTTNRAIVMCLHPDFCRRGDSIVAYDIFAHESDDTCFSRDVKITGCWASHHQARLSTVYQDSPGDAGIRSGCVEGYARPVADTSPSVLINGERCVRHDTEFEMNCNGPDGPHNTTGKMVYERGGSSNVVGEDGVPVNDADPPVELTPAEKARRMFGGADPAGARASRAALMKEVSMFWGGVLEPARDAVNMAKAIGQLGAFVYQDATGQPLDYLLDREDVTAGKQAMDQSADAAQMMIEDPVGAASAIANGVSTMVANGEASKLAGNLVGGLMLGGAPGVAKSLAKNTVAGFLHGLELDPKQLRELFTNPELNALVRDGYVSKDVANEALKSGIHIELPELKPTKDGVLIHRLSVDELVDRLLEKAEIITSKDKAAYKEALRKELVKVGQTDMGRHHLERLLNTEHNVAFIQSNENMVQPFGGAHVATRPGDADSVFFSYTMTRTEVPGKKGVYDLDFDIDGPVDVVRAGPGGSVDISIDPMNQSHPASHPYESVVAHEVTHAAHGVDGVNTSLLTRPDLIEGGFPNHEELSAVGVENMHQVHLDLPARKDYFHDDTSKWGDDGPED